MLITLVVFVSEANRAREAAVAGERRSYEVMLASAALRGALSSSDAALARYVVTGDPRFRSAFGERWARAGRIIIQLRGLTAGDPREEAITRELADLYRVRRRELTATAAQAGASGAPIAMARLREASDARSEVRFAGLLSGLTVNEQRTLAQRAAAAAASVAQANRIVRLLSLLGVCLAVFAGALGIATLQATADQRRSDRRLRSETQRAQSLEARVAERTSELEAANAELRREAADRATAEAQLRQVQKMEAVGQLTGGIAHDFNNMLAVVVGGLDLARRRVDSTNNELGQHIDAALEGANRAAMLTRRLLSFARAEPLLPEAVEPGQLIAGIVHMLERTLGERMTIGTRVGDELWTVWVDRHQLENALLNLAVNGRDAMEGDGALVISAANLSLSAGEIGQAPAGDYVCISVADGGTGMTREVLDRVFEPFFTTKPVGKGTGLGLSQIFGFIRQSNGEIVIDSTPGAGTTVSMYLPRADPALCGACRDAAPFAFAVVRDALGAGRRTVLLVEDDPRVRAATAHALRELGHDPIPCESGQSALAVLATRPDVTLVISDVIMPRMTGPELIREVTERYPEMAVLFVTGYVGDAGTAPELAGHELLRKPFTVAGLAAAVNAALARAVSGSPRLESAAAEA